MNICTRVYSTVGVRVRRNVSARQANVRAAGPCPIERGSGSGADAASYEHSAKGSGCATNRNRDRRGTM